MRRVVVLVLAGALLLVSTVAGIEPARATTYPKVPGLDQRARIIRDRFGINHVIARNDHDLFFLQGYVHAQDRLFQMDLSRRQASGRRAELLGPELLADDIQLRTVGIRRASERSLAAYSDDARRVLDAYAEGVNAWVAANPLPSEYAEVEVASFEPWTALDSASVGKLIAFGLSFDVDIFTDLDYDAYVAAGQANGFDGAALYSEDANRAEPFSDASTVPDATGTPAPNPPAAAVD
nr:penicillin acylase family protein [Acidimicrobiia bacterium]